MKTNLLSLEKGDVENGGVEVYKLEHKNFESELILVFSLCPVHFCGTM